MGAEESTIWQELDDNMQTQITRVMGEYGVSRETVALFVLSIEGRITRNDFWETFHRADEMLSHEQMDEFMHITITEGWKVAIEFATPLINGKCIV